jgi:AcrR family transcriptional regulator
MPKKNSEEKRKQIRYYAYLCFREKGYHQTSIDDICGMASISKGSFYWHYGAKLDVFIDILESWAREVFDELLEQFEKATKSPDRVNLLGEALEKEFHRARAIVPLWAEFSLLGRTDPEIQLSIGKFYRRARAAISEILRQTAAETLSEDEIKSSSAMILGAYMGIILQEFADPSTDAAQWAQGFMGILQILVRKSELSQA